MEEKAASFMEVKEASWASHETIKMKVKGNSKTYRKNGKKSLL